MESQPTSSQSQQPCNPWAKFIRKDSGDFSLSSSGKDNIKGRYTFDVETGQISCEGQPVGLFSCDLASPDPLKPHVFESDASSEIECIDVVNSEIMTEIQKPENDGAYFVLPSQLNGAEYPSHRSIVDRIDEYRYDNTGGPRGQLAVHPAPGQFVLDNAACDAFPEGINAVDAILPFLKRSGFDGFDNVNGYLQVPQVDHDRVQDCLSAFVSQLHTLRVLAMHEVPASGLLPSKRQFSNATHRVGLVYASAVPLNAYLNSTRDKDVFQFQAKIAELVLIGQYYGALKMAATKAEHRKIFLMPLGGGVFNNEWRSIARSMSLAVEMLTPEERRKLDIKALAWEGNPAELKQLCDFLRQYNKLAE